MTPPKLDPRLKLVDIMDGNATVTLRDNPNTSTPFVHRVTVGGDEIARGDGTTFTTPTYTGWAEGLTGYPNSIVGAIYPTRTAAANSLLEGLLWEAERNTP